MVLFESEIEKEKGDNYVQSISKINELLISAIDWRKENQAAIIWLLSTEGRRREEEEVSIGFKK